MRYAKIIFIAICLSGLLGGYTHCIKPPSNKSKKRNNTAIDPSELVYNNTPSQEDGMNTYGDPVLSSIDAFAQSMHPITKQYCVNCHGSFQQPLHAVSDVTQAHDAVVNSFKVNFENFESSRMVLKLRDSQHNCWSNCEDNANEMRDSIEKWYNLMTPVNSNNEQNDSRLITSMSQTVSTLFNAANTTDNGTVGINFETAMLKNPMIFQNNTTPFYIETPNGNGGNLQNNNNNAGIAYDSIRLSSANTYEYWALVDAPNDQDNSFHIKVGNNNYIEWHIPTTNGFEWRKITSTNNMTPYSVFLAGGVHNVEIRQREDGTKMSLFVITSDQSFSGGDVSLSKMVEVTFDLSSLLGVQGVTLSFDLEEFDEYSYKVSNLRINSPSSNIKVKNIKILINNVFNPQHSTYTIVDKMITPLDSTVSDYTMLMLKTNTDGTDQFSVEFEELSVN